MLFLPFTRAASMQSTSSWMVEWRRRNPLTAAKRRSNPALLLGAAVSTELATPSAIAFRLAYQCHRVGENSGAVGERPNSLSIVERSARRPSLDRLDGGVFGEDEMYADESRFTALLAWRIAYQAHRSGDRAVKGEHLDATFTLEDIRMLPVARLAERKHQLKRHEERRAERRARLAIPRPPPRLPTPPPPPPQRPVHVHVGAGRLGLGLVLPALARGAASNGGALALLQRPSAAWKELAHGAIARLTVNGELVVQLRVLRSGTAAELEATLRAAGYAQNRSHGAGAIRRHIA